MPACWKDHITRPEQSKAPGPAAPHEYGEPIRLSAAWITVVATGDPGGAISPGGIAPGNGGAGGAASTAGSWPGAGGAGAAGAGGTGGAGGMAANASR